MERKLASIQKIKKIESIPNADKIEKATVLGWECVIQKGQFKEEDFIIYCEIDSMLPKCEWSKFLFKEGDTKEKYRLRTVKLRGQISQGLILPISILNNYTEWIQVEDSHIKWSNGSDLREGDDVTELLGIEKYIPNIPAHLSGEILGDFPFFIPKTDETRIQAEPQLLELMKEKEIYITEKLDGTSATYYLKDNHFGVCSRNIELKETESNLYWKIARKYDIEKKLRIFYDMTKGTEIAIQGEIIGNGVQGNKYKLEDNELYIFNIYDITHFKYMRFDSFKMICFDHHLNIVPFIKYDTLIGDVNDWIAFSKGNSLFNLQTKREGIVVRGTEEEIIGNYGRFSFKVINPDFLIEYSE